LHLSFRVLYIIWVSRYIHVIIVYKYKVIRLLGRREYNHPCVTLRNKMWFYILCYSIYIVACRVLTHNLYAFVTSEINAFEGDYICIYIYTCSKRVRLWTTYYYIYYNIIIYTGSKSSKSLISSLYQNVLLIISNKWKKCCVQIYV